MSKVETLEVAIEAAEEEWTRLHDSLFTAIRELASLERRTTETANRINELHRHLTAAKEETDG